MESKTFIHNDLLTVFALASLVTERGQGEEMRAYQSRAVCQEESAKNDLQLGCLHNINCDLQFVLPRPFQFLLLHSPYEEKPVHLLGRRPCPQHYCYYKHHGRWSNHSWKFEITTKESQKIA